MTSRELYWLASVLEEMACSVSGCLDDGRVTTGVGLLKPEIPAVKLAAIEIIAALLHGLPAREVQIRAKTAARRMRLAASDRAIMERIGEEKLEIRRNVER